MLLFLFENNKVLSYPDIKSLSPLKPQVADRKEHTCLSVLDQSCNVMQILFVIDNIA